MNRQITRCAGRVFGTASVLSCTLLIACGSTPEESEVVQGRKLFETKALSQSHLNDYTCTTCHDTVASVPLSKKAGGALAGVTLRSEFWGGQVAELLRSVNACRASFMGDNQPLSADNRQAHVLYAYLTSLEPGDAKPISFTVVNTIDPLPRGETPEAISEATIRGQVLYAQTCQYCHGALHDGSGRLNTRVPILPEDSIAAHVQYSPRVQRLIFTEKIRHGLFLGYDGVMPPFSTEVLSDSELSDVLEALGVTGVEPSQ